MSPTAVTEQLHMLCCDVPSFSIMLKYQTTSASSLSCRFLFREGAIVLVVVKAFGIEAGDFTAAGDEPQPVAFDQRRAANALQRPIVYAAGRQLLAGMLPQKLPVGFVEAEQAAQVDFRRIPLQIAGAVVRADIDFTVGDHRIAVALRSEQRDPFDVLARTRYPFPSRRRSRRSPIRWEC